MFAFHVHGDISGLDMTPQMSTEPFVPLDPRVLMEDQVERVADRLLRAANQVDFLETLMQLQDSKNPLPFKAYTKIRDDYLQDIERTMSGTARGDPLTLAEVHMLDLTMQDEILTENSSWDLLVAAGMVDMTTPATTKTPATSSCTARRRATTMTKSPRQTRRRRANTTITTSSAPQATTTTSVGGQSPSAPSRRRTRHKQCQERRRR
jgi:hypothetical protein